jgi:hypothetical protein
MRLSVLILAFAAFGFGQSALASPKDDAAIIVNHLITDEVLEQSRAPISRAYVEAYTGALSEMSVQILDQEQFSAILPDTFTDGWVRLVRQRMVETCFRKLPVDDVRVVAGFYRTGDVNAENLPRKIKGQLDRVSLSVALCYSGTTRRLSDEIKSGDVEPLNQDMSIIADILETDGIATFPNRIVRNRLINGLRNSSH